MDAIPGVAFCPVSPNKLFVACDLSELDPLIARLFSGAPARTTEQFPLGTLLADGRLDLCKQQIGACGARVVAAALRGNGQVSAVLLGADGIGDSGAAAVAEVLDEKSAIRTVYLGCNGIGPAGVGAIVEALDRGAPLTGLWLKRNPIGDAGLKLIAGLLERNVTLRTLDLVNTQIGVEGLTALCDVLAERNRTVRRVYLGGNGIGPDGAAEVARVIKANSSICAMMLNANRLGDDGAAVLAEALPENHSLQTLALAANGIGPARAATLFSRVARNRGLLNLDFGYCASAPAVGAAPNELGDLGARSVAEMLGENETLLELDLLRTGLTPDGIALIVEALERNMMLQRISFGVAIPQALQRRLKGIFKRNRAGSSLRRAADDDILAIRSVYRS